MLPTTPDTNRLNVRRVINADESVLLDALSEFAVAQDLEVDHTHGGEGLVFCRAPKSAGAKHLLKRGDALHVTITDHGHAHEIEFVADLGGSIARRDERRRSRVVKGGLISVGLVALGVFGFRNGVDFRDLIPIAFGAGFGRRASRRMRAADADRAAIQRRVANTLVELCMRIDDPNEQHPGRFEVDLVDEDDDEDENDEN